MARRFDALIDSLYRRGISYERQLAVFLVVAFILIFTGLGIVPALLAGG